MKGLQITPWSIYKENSRLILPTQPSIEPKNHKKISLNLPVIRNTPQYRRTPVQMHPQRLKISATVSKSVEQQPPQQETKIETIKEATIETIENPEPQQSVVLEQDQPRFKAFCQYIDKDLILRIIKTHLEIQQLTEMRSKSTSMQQIYHRKTIIREATLKAKRKFSIEGLPKVNMYRIHEHKNELKNRKILDVLGRQDSTHQISKRMSFLWLKQKRLQRKRDL